jgi:L-lactate dehydrogenase complex protein LldE
LFFVEPAATTVVSSQPSCRAVLRLPFAALDLPFHPPLKVPILRMRVGLFVTCLVDLVRPRIGLCAVDLLEGAGCEVVVPATQTCCGQPGYNSGDRKAAQALARKVVQEFASCEYVVVPSGSCGGMIKAHYPELLSEFPELKPEVDRLVARTWELADFLVNVLAVNQVPGRFQGSVTYHDSCSGLRELGVKSQPRQLLSKVPGLILKEMAAPDQCCGFGGTFAVKFGDISSRIADQKCTDIASTGADAVVLGDLGCMLNIEGRLRRRGDTRTKVLHFAEVLTGGTR